MEFGYGHSISRKSKESIDKDGNPLPWFTYPCIEFLKQFDFEGKFVFEFGCGNSSLFWINNKAKVYGVEDNLQWLTKLKNQNQKDLNIEHAEGQGYINAIQKYAINWDMLVIDGKYREQCLVAALPYIGESCLILLDNAERHPILCSQLRKDGYIEIDFHGFGPINEYTWTTSLFFKRWSLVPAGIQPHVPIGGGF